MRISTTYAKQMLLTNSSSKHIFKVLNTTPISWGLSDVEHGFSCMTAEEMKGCTTVQCPVYELHVPDRMTKDRKWLESMAS